MEQKELRILFSEQSNEVIQNTKRFFEEKGIKVYFVTRTAEHFCIRWNR